MANDRSPDSQGSLEREIGAPMLAIYGAGTILGAGIYVLVGKIIGDAGLWAPVAFLAAAIVAAINGLVYAELATRSPGAGGPISYAHRAFDRRWLSVVTGWMIVFTGIASAATITTGFSHYLAHFFEMPEWAPRTALVVALATVASLGAKESAWFMAVTTTLGVAGLAFVIWTGFTHPGGGAASGLDSFLGELPPLRETAVLTGILSAAFLAVYSFIGFEDIVHLAEEVKTPSRAIPFAIVATLIAAAVLYVVTSIASLLVLDVETLDQSRAPLVDVVTAAGYPGWPLALLSLWIILNGALAQIVMASRVIFGLRKHHGAPPFLTRLHGKTRTPVAATLAVSAVILTLALFFPTESLASATSLVILLVFLVANASLIVLERRDPEADFDVPVFLPWLGLVLTLLLLIGNFFLGGGH